MANVYRLVDYLAGDGIESSGSTFLGDLYSGPGEFVDVLFSFYRGWTDGI